MLEIGARMELEAKSGEPRESIDDDPTDISFEELLAQEKKDSFWSVTNLKFKAFFQLCLFLHFLNRLISNENPSNMQAEKWETKILLKLTVISFSALTTPKGFMLHVDEPKEPCILQLFLLFSACAFWVVVSMRSRGHDFFSVIVWYC